MLDILTTEDKEELLEKTQHKPSQKKEDVVEGHEDSGSVWSFFGFEETPESEEEKGAARDSDFDGIPDDEDDDDDNDGIPDYLDEDDDGDGILDIFEDEYPADDGGADIFYDYQANEIVYEQKEETGDETTPPFGEEKLGNKRSGVEVEVPGTTKGTPVNEELHSKVRVSGTEKVTDSDGDGVPDDLDNDDDGDDVLGLLEKEFEGDLSEAIVAEVPDTIEVEGWSESETSSEATGDLSSEDGSEGDVQMETENLKDSDNDGIPDIYDDDDDNDGIPDYLDDDDDGDGILDFLEEEFTGELPTFAPEEPNEIAFVEEDEVKTEESIQESVEQTPSDDEESFEVDSETENIAGKLTPDSLKDSDNDGIPDIEDDDDDNDGIPDYLDDDDDGDGILDFLEDDYQPETTYDEKSFDEIVIDEKVTIENLDSEILKDSDNDGVPDIYDDDDDNDGIPDHLDDDDDGDGILDFLEEEFNDDLAAGLAVEVLGESFQGISRDNDANETAKDSGDEKSEAEALLGQSSADEVGDEAMEIVKEKPTGSELKDSDNDGIPDIYDEDDDNDGIPDYLDDDDDGDGILDFLEDDYQPEATYDEKSFDEIVIDDKIATENLDSENLKDSDNDGIPDVYDDDDDNDGIPDYLDDDHDGDGILDFLEDDQIDDSAARKDGRYYSESHDKETDSSESEEEKQKEVTSDERDDEAEENQDIPKGGVTDGELIGETEVKDPSLEKDSDYDGIPDYLDDDDDNDGIPDYLDDDDDGDGILDILEKDESDVENMFFDFQEYEKNGEVVSTDEEKDEEAKEPSVEDVQSDLQTEEQSNVKELDAESETQSEADGLKDSDNDGIPDIYDDDDDNDGIPDYLDDDDDGDGILDFLEEEFTGELPTFAPEEPNEIAFVEEDEVKTEESIQESVEQTPSDDEESFEVDSETENIAGKLTPDSLKDSDNDGIPDIEDDDDDNDGIPDYLDDDDDGDGILDFLEEEFTDDQAAVVTTEELAENFEEIPEVVVPEEATEYLSPEHVESKTGTSTIQSSPDEVGDDASDDVKSTSEEPPQEFLKDSDNDGIPDIYDDDDDNDGIPDYLDDDDDGDGILDFLEEEFMDDASKVLPHVTAEDSFETPEQKKIPEVDNDDGEDFLKDYHNVENKVDEDEKDESPNETDDSELSAEREKRATVKDSDDDGIPDYLDEDDDNDGVPDYMDDDDDGDGILDVLEEEFDQSDLRKSTVVVDIQKTTADDEVDDRKEIEAFKSDDSKDSEGYVAQDIPENLARLSDKDSDLDGIPDYIDDDDDNDGIPDYLDDDDDGDGILDFLDDDYQPYAFDEGKVIQAEEFDQVEDKSEIVDEEPREDVVDVEPIPDENVEVDDGKDKIDSGDDGLKDSDKFKDSDLDGIPDYLDDDDDNDGIPDYLDDDDDGDGILDFLEDDYAGYTETEVSKEADEEETEIEVEKQIASGLGIVSESREESSLGDQPIREDQLEKEEHREEPQIEKAEEEEEERDSDGDGVPDLIDDDDDNDGIPDDMDDDDDGNGVPDFLEADYVEESVNDFEYVDNKSTDTLVEESDYDSDKLKKELIDSDLDGIPDYLDDDDDNDGIPDYLDEDDDGDGILDFLEDDYVEESTNMGGIESVVTEDDQGESHDETSSKEVETSETVDQPVETKEETDEQQSESIISEEDAFSFSRITDYFFQSEPSNETAEESTKDVKPKKPKSPKVADEHKTIKEFYSVPPSQAFTPEERERFQSLVNPPEGINIDLITDSDGDGVPDYRDEDDDDDGIPDHYDPEFKLPLIIQEQLSQSDEMPNITVEENKVLLSELIQLLSNSPEEDLDPAVKGIDSEQTCQLSGILKNIEKSVPKSYCDSSTEHVESHKIPEKETNTIQSQGHPDQEFEENLDLWSAVKLFIWGNESEKEKTI